MENQKQEAINNLLNRLFLQPFNTENFVKVTELAAKYKLDIWFEQMSYLYIRINLAGHIASCEGCQKKFFTALHSIFKCLDKEAEL